MNIKLTNSEEEVMEILWGSKESLTAMEIVKLSELDWKPCYIHIMTKSLLSKGLIVVDSFKKTTKNYARTFKPLITKEEWLAKNIFSNCKTKDDLLDIMRMIISEISNLDQINECIEILNNRQKQIYKRG